MSKNRQHGQIEETTFFDMADMSGDLKTNPIVSIIMPVFNAAEFLYDSVGDILAQGYGNFELLCVYDDGTSDRSVEILEELAARDNRIKVIHHEVKGSNECRNRGIDESCGKYLLFLDADDRFEYDLLELVCGKAEECGLEVTAFDADLFDHNTGKHKSAPRLIKSEEDPNPDNPFKVLNTTVWNKLFLSSYIKENDIRFRTEYNSPTSYFVFMALVYARKLGVVRKVLLHYRIENPGSTLANIDKYPLEAYDEMLGIKERLKKDNRFEEKKDVFFGFTDEFATDRLKKMQTVEGYRELYNTLRNDGLMDLPENVETYLFDARKRMTDIGLLTSDSWVFPIPPSNEKKEVIIYGGGNVGQDYFIQIMRRSDIVLKGWVDRNHETIGYPLQSPTILKESDYDLVVIAVSHDKMASAIMCDLVGMGIPEEKIFWQKPERI